MERNIEKMNHKERVLRALRREPIDRLPKDLWVDSSDLSVMEKMLGFFGKKDYAALMDHFDIDLFRPKTPVKPEYRESEEGVVKYFVPTTDERLLTSGGGFARPLEHVETVEQAKEIDWPSPDIFDYDGLAEICAAQEERFIWAQPGNWSPIFCKICDLFGMEKCMMDMLLNPDLIHTMANTLFTYYYEVFSRTIAAGKGYIDAISFGDDYASQLCMMFDAKLWHTYFAQPVARLCRLIKDNGLLIGFHSCGAMSELIPSLIGMGVDFLFPIQPKAAGMSAERLKKEFGGQLGFYGGIDVQELLPYGTPEEVKAEVRRVAGILGKGGGYILSTAHSITRDIPLKNVAAMYEAASAIVY